ncbi:MAG: hypothetical protein HY507_00625 [Candidatus Zambryskibacteria bacterium]|nr:hypothetical protein [Candidatus Zambryskibacteria bacterium]
MFINDEDEEDEEEEDGHCERDDKQYSTARQDGSCLILLNSELFFNRFIEN